MTAIITIDQAASVVATGEGQPQTVEQVRQEAPQRRRGENPVEQDTGRDKRDRQRDEEDRTESAAPEELLVEQHRQKQPQPDLRRHSQDHVVQGVQARLPEIRVAEDRQVIVQPHKLGVAQNAPLVEADKDHKDDRVNQEHAH
jgi:hypothetical protein